MLLLDSFDTLFQSKSEIFSTPDRPTDRPNHARPAPPLRLLRRGLCHCHALPAPRDPRAAGVRGRPGLHRAGSGQPPYVVAVGWLVVIGVVGRVSHSLYISLQTPSPATATSSRRTTTRCTRTRLVSMDICDRGICSGHLIQHNSTHTTTAHMGGTADALLNPQGIAGMGPGAVTLGIKSQDEGRE